MRKRCAEYSHASGDWAHWARLGQPGGSRTGPTGPTHPLGCGPWPGLEEAPNTTRGDRALGDRASLPGPANEQIRDMLADQSGYPMTHDEWTRLDRVMHAQREKHGPEAVAWWFEEQRGVWWLRSLQPGQGGSVGR